MGLWDWLKAVGRGRRKLPYKTYARISCLTSYEASRLETFLKMKSPPPLLKVKNEQMARFYNLKEIEKPEKLEFEMALKIKKLHDKSLEVAAKGFEHGDPLEVAAEILTINPFDFTTVVAIGTAYNQARVARNFLACEHIKNNLDAYLALHGKRTTFDELLAYYDPRFQARNVDEDEAAEHIKARREAQKAAKDDTTAHSRDELLKTGALPISEAVSQIAQEGRAARPELVADPVPDDEAFHHEETRMMVAGVHAAFTSPEITQVMLDNGIPNGLVLDSCRIEKLAGKGGMGIVYKAHHEHLDRDVALKVLTKEFASKPDQVSTFQDEARAAAKIEHPNIIAVYNFGICLERPYMIMQWIQGGSMQDRLDRLGGQPMLISDALRIVSQAARGLHAAHVRDIVHRDIKPDNILITEEGVAKVADFGLAQPLEARLEGSGGGKVVGTPAYIPPEQAQGQQAGPTADVYSLGVTLFHAVTGKRPFKGSLMQVLFQHVQDPLPDARTINPSVSEALNNLIQRMTAKNPAERLQTMEEVADELDAVLNPISTRVPSVGAVAPGDGTGGGFPDAVPFGDEPDAHLTSPFDSPVFGQAPDLFDDTVTDQTGESFFGETIGDTMDSPFDNPFEPATPTEGESESLFTTSGGDPFGLQRSDIADGNDPFAEVSDPDAFKQTVIEEPPSGTDAPASDGTMFEMGTNPFEHDDADATGADPRVTPDVMDKGLEPGMVIGGCRIEKILGKGAMGIVYEAHQLGADRRVAVKVMGSKFADNSMQRRRFQEEAVAAARIHHDNLVTVHGFGKMHNRPYIIMQYVGGQSLMERMAEGDIPLEELVEIFAQAADGLAAAHQAAVIHRDVKPDNIMVGDDGVIRVADFGLAKQTEADESLSVTGTVMGTPHYMPPEQVRAFKDIDHRADIYALGLTLFHAATGTTPYQGDPMKVLFCQVNQPLPDPKSRRPELPDPLVAVIRKMGAKERDDRYQTMHDVKVALRRVLDPEAAELSMVGATAEIDFDQMNEAFAGFAAESGVQNLEVPDAEDTLVEEDPRGDGPRVGLDGEVDEGEGEETIIDALDPDDPDHQALIEAAGEEMETAIREADPFASAPDADDSGLVFAEDDDGFTADEGLEDEFDSGISTGADIGEPDPFATDIAAVEDDPELMEGFHPDEDAAPADDFAAFDSAADAAAATVSGVAGLGAGGTLPEHMLRRDPSWDQPLDDAASTMPAGDAADTMLADDAASTIPATGRIPVPESQSPESASASSDAAAASVSGFATEQLLALIAGLLLVGMLFLPLATAPASTADALGHTRDAVVALQQNPSVAGLEAAEAAWTERTSVEPAPPTAKRPDLLTACVADATAMVGVDLAADAQVSGEAAGELFDTAEEAATRTTPWTVYRFNSTVGQHADLVAADTASTATNSAIALMVLPLIALLLLGTPLAFGFSRHRMVYRLVTLVLELAGLAVVGMVLMLASPLAGGGPGIVAGSGVGFGSWLAAGAAAVLVFALLLSLGTLARRATPAT